MTAAQSIQLAIAFVGVAIAWSVWRLSESNARTQRARDLQAERDENRRREQSQEHLIAGPTPLSSRVAALERRMTDEDSWRSEKMRDLQVHLGNIDVGFAELKLRVGQSERDYELARMDIRSLLERRP